MQEKLDLGLAMELQEQENNASKVTTITKCQLCGEQVTGFALYWIPGSVVPQGALAEHYHKHCSWLRDYAKRLARAGKCATTTTIQMQGGDIRAFFEQAKQQLDSSPNAALRVELIDKVTTWNTQ